MRYLKVCPLIFAGLLFLGSSSFGTLVIGGFNSDRIDISSLESGFPLDDLRGRILSSFPGATFAGTNLLTPGFLNTVDCLIIGAPKFGGVTSLSPEEQEYLLAFVKAGGGAIIFCDNDDHAGVPISDDAAETFLDPFGIDATGSLGSPQIALSIAPDHPVMNGRFGQVEGMATYFSGWFDNLGPYALRLADYENGEAALLAIPHGALGPGSGAVVFISDANIFVGAEYGGYLSEADNSTLILNSIDYVTTPEPSVLLAGLFGFGILAGRRKRRG